VSKKPVPPQLLANQFKPGQSGNPGGQRAGEAKLLKLTKHEVAKMLNSVSEMTLTQLKAAYESPETKAIQKLFIKTLIDGLKGDSVRAAEFILTRIIGKPKDDVQISFPRRTIKKLDGTVIEYTNEPEDEA